MGKPRGQRQAKATQRKKIDTTEVPSLTPSVGLDGKLELVLGDRAHARGVGGHEGDVVAAGVLNVAGVGVGQRRQVGDGHALAGLLGRDLRLAGRVGVLDGDGVGDVGRRGGGPVGARRRERLLNTGDLDRRLHRGARRGQRDGLVERAKLAGGDKHDGGGGRVVKRPGALVDQRGLVVVAREAVGRVERARLERAVGAGGHVDRAADLERDAVGRGAGGGAAQLLALVGDVGGDVGAGRVDDDVQLVLEVRGAEPSVVLVAHACSRF